MVLRSRSEPRTKHVYRSSHCKLKPGPETTDTVRFQSSGWTVVKRGRFLHDMNLVSQYWPGMGDVNRRV